MRIPLHPVDGAGRVAGAFNRFVSFAKAKLVAKSAPPADQEEFLLSLDAGDLGDLAECVSQSFARWLGAIIVKRRESSLALARRHRRRRGLPDDAEAYARQRRIDRLLKEDDPLKAEQPFDFGSSGPPAYLLANASL